MLRSTCIFLVFACFTVYADKTTDSARFLKWSQGLNAHFKSGFPKENISSIDPYNVEKSNRAFFPLGTYKNAKLTMQLADYQIKGLGDRKVINASTTYYKNYKNQPTVSVSCYVTYNEITVEGKFVIFPRVNSSSPVISNVTGNLKFVSTWEKLKEMYLFNGTEGQATKYEFLDHYVFQNPHHFTSNATDYYRGAFTFSGVPKELEDFVRSGLEASQEIYTNSMHYLIFFQRMIHKARHEICSHSWDNTK